MAVATRHTTSAANTIEAVGDWTDALGTERSHEHRLDGTSGDGVARREGSHRAAARFVEPGQRELTYPSSLPALLDLWTASWETALAALATAAQARTLGTAEAAAHRTAIAAEREIVSRQLRLLLSSIRFGGPG